MRVPLLVLLLPDAQRPQHRRHVSVSFAFPERGRAGGVGGGRGKVPGDDGHGRVVVSKGQAGQALLGWGVGCMFVWIHDAGRSAPFPTHVYVMYTSIYLAPAPHGPQDHRPLARPEEAEGAGLGVGRAGEEQDGVRPVSASPISADPART